MRVRVGLALLAGTVLALTGCDAASAATVGSVAGKVAANRAVAVGHFAVGRGVLSDDPQPLPEGLPIPVPIAAVPALLTDAVAEVCVSLADAQWDTAAVRAAIAALDPTELGVLRDNGVLGDLSNLSDVADLAEQWCADRDDDAEWDTDRDTGWDESDCDASDAEGHGRGWGDDDADWNDHDWNDHGWDDHGWDEHDRDRWSDR